MQHNVSYYRQVNFTIPGIAGGNTGTDFTFMDQPDVRYARTTGIVAYFANDVFATQPDNVPVIADNLAPRVSIVFETNDPDDPIIDKNGQKMKLKGNSGRFTGTLDTIQWIPLTQLHCNQNFGVSPGSFARHMIHWKDRYIVWQKTHIKINQGGLGNTSDVAICLGVFYSFIDEFGKPIDPRN